MRRSSRGTQVRVQATLVADAKELNAEELDEVILEACDDQAVDLIIEAILVANAEELNAEELDEVILEAEGPRVESKLH